MNIGLVGLNQTGKTTLFRLLTDREDAAVAGGRGTANIGTCFVPDERIDFLSKLYNPKKTTYAKIEAVDVAGLTVSSNEGARTSRFLNDVRPCDALLHVLRAFENDAVAHDMGSIDPARDLETVETELLFADLEMIEKRISRIRQGKKITKEHEIEIALLQRCYNELEDGGSILAMDLTQEERLAIRGFAFLTEKPRLVVANLDESRIGADSWQGKDALEALCAKLGFPLLELCVDMEMEINRLPPNDRQAFMADIGIEESGVSVLARAIYKLLRLISFLTVGDDEVRAWTIEEGTDARSAAGKIHTDIERGFIRAEVVKYKDLFELGSMAKVKEKGLFRLEGKQYIVNDGDIINFRFNV